MFNGFGWCFSCGDASHFLSLLLIMKNEVIVALLSLVIILFGAISVWTGEDTRSFVLGCVQMLIGLFGFACSLYCLLRK